MIATLSLDVHRDILTRAFPLAAFFLFDATRFYIVTVSVVFLLRVTKQHLLAAFVLASIPTFVVAVVSPVPNLNTSLVAFGAFQ